MIPPRRPEPPSSFRFQSILAFGLGMLAVLGFAPLQLYLLPVIVLAVLFLLWGRAPSRAAAARTGFAFGLGFFSAGVSWVYISLNDFGGMPLPLAMLATILLCAFLALLPALAGYLQAFLGPNRTATRYLLLIPSLWTLAEWTRGWIFTGFPWLTVGYSQVPDSALAGFAPLFGVYGVSLAVAFSAGLLALAADNIRAAEMRARLKPLAALALLWLVGFGLKAIPWTHPAGAPVTVSLLQGNIPQEMKWREEKVRSTLETYLRMTFTSSSRLIILPETALPMFLDEVPPLYLEMLATIGRSHGGDVMVGVPEYGKSGNKNGDYYNSVLTYGSNATQTYRKYHLVPFGEYVPLKPLLGWVIRVLHIPLSDFSRGNPMQPPLQVAGQKAAVAICYEDVFGEELIHQLPEATLLVNLSNDAWFGRSIAPRQHLQISQMRALETGRYMLRSTNTGVTAIIDQRGQVQAQAPTFTATRLDGTAQGFVGSTPFVRWGNAGVLTVIEIMLLVAALISRRRAKPDQA